MGAILLAPKSQSNERWESCSVCHHFSPLLVLDNEIARDTSFPSPAVAVHSERKQCVEGLHFIRKKCIFYPNFLRNLIVYHENITKTTRILKMKVFNAFSTGLRICEKCAKFGFFPFPSLLPSLILRYFGDHGRISQRSIRFKIIALATKRSNTERSYRF